jgi:8-oxo-dGTP pyrophosphatase MutT (NUDIX family)
VCLATVASYAGIVSWLIDRLSVRLTPDGPRPLGDGGRRAAVSVVLHDAPAGPEVLLMKRAERVGDPWSGHISLPGGRHEPYDPDLLATAIRETHEELQIDLATTRYLGQLDPLHPRSAGPNGIEVTPFVFTTETALATTCGAEALSAFWLPLEMATSGELDGTHTYPGSTMSFPSWTYEGHVIWGLTLRILIDVMSIAKRESQGGD